MSQYPIPYSSLNPCMMSNNNHFIAIGFLLVMTSLSCTNMKYGDWEQVKLDKYEVSFDEKGGEDEIISINYPGIHILHLENLDTMEVGNLNNSPNGASMDGIELRTKGNKLFIKVSASEESRSWRIELCYYDASCLPVYVYQN